MRLLLTLVAQQNSPSLDPEKTAGLSVKEGQQDQKRHWRMCQSREIARMSFNSFFYPETSFTIEVAGQFYIWMRITGFILSLFHPLPKESFCFMICDINAVCLFLVLYFVKLEIKAQLINDNIMFLMTNKK